MSSTEPRDQLADVALGALHAEHLSRTKCAPDCDHVIALRNVAQAVTEAAAGWRPPPRRIETPEELDALQPVADMSMVPALIRCADNFVFERATDIPRIVCRRPAWYRPGSSVQRYSDELAFPVTVLVEPEAGR